MRIAVSGPSGPVRFAEIIGPRASRFRASVVKKGSGATEPQPKEDTLARIAGVNIPTGKRVPIALTYIHGIGDDSARSICEAVGIDLTRRVNELSDAEVLAVREHIDANFTCAVKCR